MSIFENIKTLTSRDSIYNTGTIIEANNSQYSSTSVYGGTTGHGNGTRISSRVRYHQDQKIFVRWDNGHEQALDFYNQNVNARSGHRVRAYYSKYTNNLTRFLNLSTGEFWRTSGTGRYMNETLGDKGSKSLFKTNRIYKRLIRMLPIISLLSIARCLNRQNADFPYHVKYARLSRLILPIWIVLVLNVIPIYAFSKWTENKSVDLGSITIPIELQADVLRVPIKALLYVAPYIDGDYKDAKTDEDKEKYMDTINVALGVVNGPDEAFLKSYEITPINKMNVTSANKEGIFTYLAIAIFITGRLYSRVFGTADKINSGTFAALESLCRPENNNEEDVKNDIPAENVASSIECIS